MKYGSLKPKEIFENFLVGGLLVLFALLVANYSNPVVGGIIAALPIRFGITWAIGAARNGSEFAENMARGSIIGMAGNLMFSLTLFFTLLGLGFFLSFFLGLAVCLIAILAIRFTFQE